MRGTVAKRLRKQAEIIGQTKKFVPYLMIKNRYGAHIHDPETIKAVYRKLKSWYKQGIVL